MLNTLSSETLAYLSSLGVDVLALVVVAFVLSSLGFVKGKYELIALLLAVYPAALLTLLFPYAETLGFGNGPLDKTLMFGSFLLVGTLLFRMYIETSFTRSRAWRVVEILILALACTGATLATLIHVCNVEQLYAFSPLIRDIFGGPVGLFWWLVGPLASIPLFVRS